MANQYLKKERIGLLFVHGIGEQERFEYLKSSVREFAELLRLQGDDSMVSVVDRTMGWISPAGQPDLEGEAPMTLSVVSVGHHIDFECHEVWWADLGASSGIVDIVTFWFWGLGQWGAPIYQELDAAGMDAEKLAKRPKTILPESVAGSFGQELLARFRLLWAAIAAIYTLFTWTLVKRVFSKLFSTAPSPTLIEQYVGDVRLYEERARPGKSHPGDPGMPLRVAIRRRMISEMVAVSTRAAREEYDGWYLISHSLGTVVAYNGLTEIGHTLPNYLPRSLWERVRTHFTDRDAREKTPLRYKVTAMMPARPAWLADDEVINREKLFAKLRGVLTYGSPLAKFAALWPRIIATSKSDAEGNPFGGSRPDGAVPWVNLASANDPVAGKLEGFGRHTDLGDSLPELHSHSTPLAILGAGIAHIRYFIIRERTGSMHPAMRQRLWVMKWLQGEREEPFPSVPTRWHGIASGVSYALMTAFLVVAASVLLLVFQQGLSGLVAGKAAPDYLTVDGVLEAISITFHVALSGIAVAGLLRWARESQLNYRLAAFDGKNDPHKQVVARELLRYHRLLGWLCFVAGSIPVMLIMLGKLRVLADTTVASTAAATCELHPPFVFLCKANDGLWWALHWFQTSLPPILQPDCFPVMALIVIAIAALLQVAINMRWQRGETSGKWSGMVMARQSGES